MRRTISLAVAAAAGLLLTGCGSASSPTGPPTPSASVSATTPAPATQPATSAPPSTPPPTTPAPFSYVPLYPFTSVADANAWQRSYGSGGHQPWHLSADLTALAFTQGYLGFSEIDRVAARTVTAADAHVTVGLKLPNGQLSHAATIHLIKFGTGKYAPWEVVGTDDTTLTLDIPAYGATVASPATVGGKITGVDENLGIEIRRLGASEVVGYRCCVPAGGQATPWSVPVSFHAAPGQVLTIAVHTGGHVAGVERFAVTGVRAG